MKKVVGKVLRFLDQEDWSNGQALALFMLVLFDSPAGLLAVILFLVAWQGTRLWFNWSRP